jgi:ATP-dependent RNA helicase DeaD
MKYYRIIPIYGGSKIDTQIKALKKYPKIVVCTPGRLNDLIKRRRIELSLVKYFVLDEADEMLSMGFKSEIDKVLDKIPLDRKIYLFSATLSEKVKKITQTYMKNPIMISTSPLNQGAETVKHIYYISDKSKRYEIMRNIIDINKNIYTIIFCRTRRETKNISSKLISDNYNAKVLNGDLSQNERDQVMNQFRTKKINILVATDVASRGIDVENLSHIINYNLPDDPEVYVHRSGRTGRAGKQGLSIALISKKEYYRLEEIKKLSKISFEKNEIPRDIDVFKSKIHSFTDKVISASIPCKKDRDIFENIYSKLNDFTKEEIIGKFITLNIENSKVSKNITNREKDLPKKKIKQEDNRMSKLSINIGRFNKLNPEMLIRLINKTVRSRDTQIGKIDIKKNHATFEVDSRMEDIIIAKMQNIRHLRKRISVSNYDHDIIELPLNKKKKFRKKRKGQYKSN